jgi:hypothetical protein
MTFSLLMLSDSDKGWQARDENSVVILTPLIGEYLDFSSDRIIVGDSLGVFKLPDPISDFSREGFEAHSLEVVAYMVHLVPLSIIIDPVSNSNVSLSSSLDQIEHTSVVLQSSSSDEFSKF